MTTISQKKAALEKHKKASQAGMLYHSWNHLDTVSIDLYDADEPLPDEFDIEDFVQTGVAQADLLLGSHATIFIRACPLQPRPGVLESSPANNLLEAEEILTRIITTMLSKDTSPKPMYEHGFIDPHGSIIIQPYINADASCVIAPNNYIMMGEGNDGITASRDCIKVALPHLGDSRSTHDFKQLGIDPNLIELEFVSEMSEDNTYDFVRSSNQLTHYSYIVQLRGSEGARPISPPPKGVTISGTFHGAERININHIHLVSDNSDEQLDLMEQALREGMPDGAVVLHPTGNHLSHHAGQCFKYGVPYIASVEPKVGEQWTQAAAGWVVLDNDGTYEPQPYDPAEYIDAFKAGLEYGLYNFARQHGWLSNHFHQFLGGPLYNPAQTAVLAGAYVGWLINGTLSVGLGECRHAPSTTSNSNISHMAVIHAVYGADIWIDVHNETHLPHYRQSYYAAIEKYPMDYETTRGLYDVAIDIFGKTWNTGYGGEKYKQSMLNGRDLLDAVNKFFIEPNENTLKDVTDYANTTEHNVHNNGYFFNKFMDKTALDWGTDPANITIEPYTFFRVFYAALDVLKSTDRNTVLSNTAAIDEYKSLTMNKLKKTPLALNKDTPLLAASVSHLSKSFRHPQGTYAKYGTKGFIQCGVDNCSICSAHQEELYKNLDVLAVPYNTYETGYDMTFPTDNHEMSEDDLVAKNVAMGMLNLLKKQVNTAKLTGDFSDFYADEFAKLCYLGQTTQKKFWDDEMVNLASKVYGKLNLYQQDYHLKTIKDLKKESEENGETQ